MPPLVARIRRPTDRVWLDAEMRDTSMLGAALSTPHGVAEALDFAVRVEVTLELPLGPVLLDGTIRRRSYRAHGVLFGIEFEPETSPTGQLGRLQAWLSGRLAAA